MIGNVSADCGSQAINLLPSKILSEKFTLSSVNQSSGLSNVERRSRYVMVAKFLDDNKPIKSLKKLLALFQTLPILFIFI